jgi:Uma2 family endonuclease
MAQQLASPPLLPGGRYPMSLEEYRALPEIEGLKIEWVDGEAIVVMPPLLRHGQLTMFFIQFLGGFVNLFDLGQIYAELLGVELPSRPSVRLPDIVVVLSEHEDRLTREGLVGAADLLMEILSQDSATRDRRDKFAEYEAAGVPEYIVVEGREGRTGFWYYRLDEKGRYRRVEPDEAGRFHSVVLPGFWIDPAWLGQSPLPNPLKLLKLIAPAAIRRLADTP